ncbi:hypothetical protein ACEWY4_004941 [Coilia grayii]|uniref:Protein Jade-1 n=1 Tax=Coilia grayii TaxID=363190 RepID=A0ABD1KHJ1_9TELE
MKRNWHPSSSDDSDTGSTSTSLSQHSKSHSRRSQGKKPSEVFRTDLITAMKLHDSYQLNPDDYYVLADSWRQEWEKGVQVPVSPHSIPQPVVRTVAEKPTTAMFSRPKKMIRSSGYEPPVLGYVGVRTLAEGVCRYDLDEEDVAWLQITNRELSHMGMQQLEELTMERVMEEFERSCYDSLRLAVETEEGLGIEYDEDVVCDVCQSPDGEDGNEMVFCDKCNICVHQACYGILKVPEGSWLCRICALGIAPRCQLCPKRGGAMKPTRSGTKWVHVSCALWIPEVSIGNPEKMEPITNISHIPSNRLALSCCLCKDRTGACIQCSAKSCRTAFHVTCGQRGGLKMSTVLTEADEVKFKSFCPQHSGLRPAEGEREGGAGTEGTGAERGDKGAQRPAGRRGRKAREPNPNLSQRPAAEPAHSEGVRVSERKQRLQQLEDEFYRLVAAGEVARRLGVAEEAADLLFQYWKLKRRANFNQPLVTPKREEEESLARREQEVLLRRLRLFTHLRQDLERVRNLTYMVTRREKIKRSVCRVQEQIFQQHIRLLEQDRFTGLSSTRRLSEALFYFRGPPNTPFPSPRALKGHAHPNTPLTPSTATQPHPTSTPLPPKSTQVPPNPVLKLEKQTPRGGGASSSSQEAARVPRPPRTNGFLPAKAPRANGVLPAHVGRTNGVAAGAGRPPKDTEGSSCGAPVVDTRRITRGDSTRAAMPKPHDPRERQNGDNRGAHVTPNMCMRVGDLGLRHTPPPHLIPTLRLTPVAIPPHAQITPPHAQIMPPHAQICTTEERRRKPRDPSPVRSKVRTSLRVSQDQQKPSDGAGTATDTETSTRTSPTAVTTETKYNGALRRLSSGAECAGGRSSRAWGSFRIPRRGERGGRGGQQGVEPGGAGLEPHNQHLQSPTPSLPRRTSERTSAATHATPPALRTRLRGGTENQGAGRAGEGGHEEREAQGKRWHGAGKAGEGGQEEAQEMAQGKRWQAQRLRRHDVMAQRYGSDIIRRGVLAS